LTYFGPVFVAAPFFSLISTIIHVKTTLTDFNEYSRRSQPQGAKDIGVWLDVIELTSFMAIVTSIAVIVFTSDQLMLLFSNETGPIFDWAILLILAVAVEHIMFLLKYLMASMIPDVPDFIEEMDQRKQGKLDIVNDEF